MLNNRVLNYISPRAGLETGAAYFRMAYQPPPATARERKAQMMNVISTLFTPEPRIAGESELPAIEKSIIVA